MLQQGLKQKRPGLAGAQFHTGILYRDGNAGQVKKLGARKGRVKIRSLKTEGCGTRQKVKTRSLRKTIRNAKNALKIEGCSTPRASAPPGNLELEHSRELRENDVAIFRIFYGKLTLLDKGIKI